MSDAVDPERRAWLDSLKPGDEVVTGRWQGCAVWRTSKVERRTPKRIVLATGNAYRASDGRPVGRGCEYALRPVTDQVRADNAWADARMTLGKRLANVDAWALTYEQAAALTAALDGIT